MGHSVKTNLYKPLGVNAKLKNTKIKKNNCITV